MKLLFDENLSPKLPLRLADIFPNSLHVRDVGMKATVDPIVWDYAKDNNLTLVSKDADQVKSSNELATVIKLEVRRWYQNY